MAIFGIYVRFLVCISWNLQKQHMMHVNVCTSVIFESKRGWIYWHLHISYDISSSQGNMNPVYGGDHLDNELLRWTPVDLQPPTSSFYGHASGSSLNTKTSHAINKVAWPLAIQKIQTSFKINTSAVNLPPFHHSIIPSSHFSYSNKAGFTGCHSPWSSEGRNSVGDWWCAK